MIRLIRTDAQHEDFIHLVTMLDAELRIRDGEDHFFYAQFNTLDSIKHAVVAYKDDEAIACGAFREYADSIVEIKRMFVRKEFRGQGVAGMILSELESWAGEHGFQTCILETGHNQPEAIRLYQKSGYSTIPNYSPYEEVTTSICMKKVLKSR